MRAAKIYATGGTERVTAEGEYGSSLIYNTSAHQGRPKVSSNDGDPAEITVACNNLAILTGNFGRSGGGVATMRGPANYQGVTDMGAHPALLPGGLPVADAGARAGFEAAWLGRWAEKAKTSNGFVPVRSLPTNPGLALDQMIEAIESGKITAMYVEGTLADREQVVNPRLLAALDELQFLVVADVYDSALTEKAHVVLPLATNLEKDGTFTNVDRVVQRVRAAIPAMGEAKSAVEAMSMLSVRMGYGMTYTHASTVMNEIADNVEDYGGVTYARLERGGLSVPVTSVADAGASILVADGSGRAAIRPTLVSAGH